MNHSNSFIKGQSLTSPEVQENQSFVNALNGQLNYNGRELSFSNKNGTLKIVTPIDFKSIVKEIVGNFPFEDELILFTKSSEDEIKGHTWSVKEVSENSYTFDKIHEADYNFEDGTRLRTVGVNENRIYKRVYFTDGKQDFRSINVAYPELSNLSIDELNVFPKTPLGPPIVKDITSGGSVKASMVQYCYRLVSINGNMTKFSMYSDRSVILNNYSDLNGNETAGLAGDNTGKIVKIEITDIDFSKFKIIEAYAINYEIKDTITSVALLGKQNLKDNKVVFYHDGTESTSAITIDEILSNSNDFKIVQTIETFENLFLAADITYSEIEDYDFDSKIIQANLVNVPFTDDYNPNPKSFKYLPYGNDTNNLVLGGESKNYKNGNGIRISFTVEQEEMSEAEYVNENLPNPNVSYGYNNDSITLTENYDKFGDRKFNESIRYSPNKASYQRGEVYRLGFKATKNNQNTFVKYIGDIYIPSVSDYVSYLDGDTYVKTSEKYVISEVSEGILYGNAIYLKVDVKLPQEIVDNFDHFEILRVKRKVSDKTILDQGVLFPTADYDPDYIYNDDDNKYPSGYSIRPGVQLNERISFINYASLYMNEEGYKLGSIYSFDSPKTVSQNQDYEEEILGNLKIISSLKVLKYENKILNKQKFNGYIPSGGHYYYNTGNYHRHILYKHVYYNFIEFETIEKGYFAGSNQIIPSGKFPSVDKYKLGNFGLGSWSNERQKEGLFNISSSDIDTMYYDDPNKNRFRLPSAAPTLFLKLSSDYLSQFEKIVFDGDYSEFPFLETRGILNTLDNNAGANWEERLDLKNGVTIISNLILVNLERTVTNQYGGRDDYAISQNQYTSIFKKKITTNEYSFVLRNGDIYIDIFHHQKFSLKDSPDMPSDFWNEPDKNVTTTGSISVVIETETPQIFAKGNKIISNGVDVEDGDNYTYNNAYISEDAKISITKPFNFEDVIDFPNLIQVSDVKLKGDQIDSWSNFNPVNFHELDLNKGDITNFIKIQNLLFATQSNEGLSQIFINSRAIIPSQDGRNIAIGTDSAINIEYSKEISKYGTSFFDSIAFADDSFMYLNDKFKKIIMFKGGVVSITDATFNQNSFYEKLKNKVINDVVGVYDERYSEMILCVDYGDNEQISVYFNNDNKFNVFCGNTDFKSNQFIQFKNKIFAKHNLNELHIKNEGTKGSYFGEVKNFEIEFVVNAAVQDVKMFDNFIGNIKSSDVKFKELKFSTNLTDEQVLLGNDDRYRIREGKHLIPYREKFRKPRMRGDYMNVKIIFDNSQNKEISIFEILTTIRKSFK